MGILPSSFSVSTALEKERLHLSLYVSLFVVIGVVIKGKEVGETVHTFDHLHLHLHHLSSFTLSLSLTILLHNTYHRSLCPLVITKVTSFPSSSENGV